MGKKGIIHGKISELISYQDGSIVSREMIREETGTVTLLAIDKGKGLNERAAPYDVLVQVTEGEGTITIEGKPYNLKEGEIILMPAGKPHSVACEEKFKMMLVVIKSDQGVQ